MHVKIRKGLCVYLAYSCFLIISKAWENMRLCEKQPTINKTVPNQLEDALIEYV